MAGPLAAGFLWPGHMEEITNWVFRYVTGIRLLSLLCSFWLFPLPVWATHIVGGEMGYRCLGNNRYEVTLRVFRDCFNAADGAGFDDPATIGVFNREGLLVTTLSVHPKGIDTLSDGIDPCLIVSRPVCVNTTTYQDTVTLPFRLGGYHFAYQRCCRNQTIVNIVNPLETGATFDILLTEAAMRDCNASPVIKAWPPVYVCNNRPLKVDVSATDMDFDSLVYRFCTPFQGATYALFIPVPPDGPPYDTVRWVSPTYHRDNMMGGEFPLTIHPKTGIMSGIPQIMGQFVVGVCVEEYDRVTKVLLSQTRRDFQYNVVNCTGANASFRMPDEICRNAELMVERDVSEATTFEWYLGEGEHRELVSSDFLVRLKFREAGSYLLTLVTDRGQFCESTFAKRFQVVGNALDFSFQALDFPCENYSRFNLRDLSRIQSGNPIRYDWTVRYPGSLLSSSQREPIFQIPLGASGTITLKTTSATQCIDSLVKTFTTSSPENLHFGLAVDTADVCRDSLVLQAKSSASPTRFRWLTRDNRMLGEGPRLILSWESMRPFKLVGVNRLGCQDSLLLSLQSYAPSRIDASYPDSLIFCDTFPKQLLPLSPQNSASLTYSWTLDGKRFPGDTLSGPRFSYPSRKSMAFVLMRNAKGCLKEDSVRLLPGALAMLSAGNDTVVCHQDAFRLQIRNPVAGVDYRWSEQADFREILGRESAISATLNHGPNLFYVRASDSLGCVLTDTFSVRVAAIRVTLPAAPVRCVIPDTVRLDLINRDSFQSLTYDWFPAGLLIRDASMGASARFLVTDTTSLGVSVRNQFGCTNTLRTPIVFTNNGLPVRLNAGRDTSLCSLGALTLSATANAPLAISWSLSPTFNTVLGQGNSLTYSPQRGINTLFVRGHLPDGCSFDDTLRLSAFPVAASLPAIHTACLPVDTFRLFVTDRDTSQGLNYLWSPFGIIRTDPLEGPQALATISRDTSVSVLLLNKYGCQTILSSRLNLVGPAITIEADRSTLIRNKGEKAILRVRGCPVCTFLWSPFNTLNSFTDSVVTAMPMDTTLYKVVATRQGCSSFASIRISVDNVICDAPNIFVPTAFTPNADGANDQLQVRGRWITSMRFVVYNRYGQEVFGTTDQTKSWDGTFNGKTLGPDVFGYYLFAQCVDGSSYGKRGNVTLIR